jgi:hypothetical protein
MLSPLNNGLLQGVETENIKISIFCSAAVLLPSFCIKSLQNLNHIAYSFVRGGETILIHTYKNITNTILYSVKVLLIEKLRKL